MDLPLSRTAEALRRLFDRGHVLTRRRAADRLGVSDRQVSRLLDELRAADVPVRDCADPHASRAKAFYLAPEDQRRGIVLEGLDEQALLALTVAAEAAGAALAGTSLEVPLRRGFRALLNAVDALPDDTGAEAGPDTFEPAAIPAAWHFGGIASQPPDSEVFATVRAALTAQQAIRIDYVNGKGEVSRGREIKPLALAPVRGVWLLAAHCKLRDALREFNLARMSNVRTVSRYFLRPDGFDARRHFAGRFGALEGGDPVDVVLRVSPERATYFKSRRYHASQEIEPVADGSLRIHYRVPGGAGLDELAAWVRSWGPYVIVEGPTELAEHVAADARATAAQYADFGLETDVKCPSSDAPATRLTL